MTATDPAPNPEALIARRAIPLLDLTDLGVHLARGAAAGLLGQVHVDRLAGDQRPLGRLHDAGIGEARPHHAELDGPGVGQ